MTALSRLPAAATLSLNGRGSRPHIFTASVTAWLQAPSGFLVITGESPP